MNTFCRILAACVFGSAMIMGAGAADQVKPPSFLKVGSRYSFFFADRRELDKVYAEIVEFGPGTWMRVQYVVPDEAGRRRLVSAKEAPVPGTKLGESWYNLSMLAAAVPADKQGSNVIPTDTSTFPKVGTTYCFNGQSTLPFFGKVIELGDGGWFRAKEMKPKWSKEQPRDQEWWINMAFVTQLTEAKPKDLPE